MAKKFYGDGGRLQVVKGGLSKGMQARYKEVDEKLQQTANLKDVIEISRAAADDVITEHVGRVVQPMSESIIGNTAHLATMQKILVDKGFVTMDEYEEILKSVLAEYEAQRDKAMKEFKEGDKVDTKNDAGDSGLSEDSGET